MSDFSIVKKNYHEKQHFTYRSRNDFFKYHYWFNPQ